MTPNKAGDGALEQTGLPFGVTPDLDFRGQLDPFVAPIASNAGVVSKDRTTFEVAKAVYAAFGDFDDGDGLTRGAIIAACGPHLKPDVVDPVIGMFLTMDLLTPHGGPDRSHQVRYCFNPKSAAGLLVYERVIAVGGIQEITLLLSRTVEDIENGSLNVNEVLERITQARHGLTISTSNLRRLVSSRTIEELLAERRSQRAADDLLAEARALVTAVADQFHTLAGAGQRLIRAAGQYCAAVNELWDRLLESARARRDFSMLAPEQYLTAALKSSPRELAAALVATVFDPPSLSISADQVMVALDDFRPRPTRIRPPRPPESRSDHDPLKEIRLRVERARERRIAAAEIHLQGTGEADLTSAIRAAGWPGAARIVVETLLADMDSSIPFAVALSQALLVDPPGPVSYVTPMSLVRLSVETSAPAKDESFDHER